MRTLRPHDSKTSIEFFSLSTSENYEYNGEQAK